MTNKKITTSAFSIVTSALVLASIVAVPAYAETSVGLDTSVMVSASSTTTTGSTSVKTNIRTNAKVNLAAKKSESLTKIITRGNTAISARIDDLNKLNTKVQGLKNVSATEKSSISSEVQTNITGLTYLKEKIDADTDNTVALSDEKTITANYRIYALIVPRGHLYASADRVKTIVGLMTTIGAKIQARITTEQSAGKDVTAIQASLVEFNTKIADANAQAETAITAMAKLTPDQGDKTKLAANTAALKSARANIKTATDDLKTARQDMKTIICDINCFGQ